jgi:hypothetical protein
VRAPQSGTASGRGHHRDGHLGFAGCCCLPGLPDKTARRWNLGTLGSIYKATMLSDVPNMAAAVVIPTRHGRLR